MSRHRVLVGLLVAAVLQGCGSPDLLEQAKWHQQAGRYQESLIPLRTLLSQGVKDPEVDLLYGQALHGVGTPMMAVWALSRAMKDPEFFEPAGLALAAGALAAKEYDLSVRVTGDLLESSPDDINALIVRAMARVGTRRDYEGAIEDADRALAIDPDAVKAQVARTISLLGLDRAEEAGEWLDVVEDYYANDELNQQQAGLYCAARVSFESEKGEAERAGEVILECLERYPKSKEVVAQALEYYDGQELYDRSAEVMRQAMQADPDFSDYRVGLARRLDATGQVEEAASLLRAATEVDDPNRAALAFFDLAGYLVSRGEFDQGIEAFEEGIALVGQVRPDRLFAFADALIVAGRYDQAVKVADGMKNVPYQELVYGRVAFEQADYERALEHFAAGLLLWPDNSVARYLAGRAAEELGDFDRAVEEYRYALRIDAGATDARKDLARLYLAQGEPGPALQVIRHGIDRAAPDLETALIEVEILMEVNPRRFQFPQHLAEFRQVPRFMRESLNRMLDKERERGGPEASAALMSELSSWDRTDPQNAPLIRGWVADLVAVGRPATASELIAAALAAHPDAAGFHAVRGLFLEQTGAPAEEVQAAFARAVELNPQQADALAGRARHSAASGRLDEAVEFYLRSAEGRPRSTEALWAAIEVLRGSGESQRLPDLLAQVLERDPYNGSAAFELARIYAAGGASEQALPLARRAARFEGSPEAQALAESLSVPTPAAEVDASN